MLLCDASCCYISLYVIACYAVLGCDFGLVVLRYDGWHPVVLCCGVDCHVAMMWVVLCCVMPWCTVLCCVVLRFVVVLRYALWWSVS